MSIDHLHFRQALQHTPFHDRYAAMSTTEHWATWNTYKVPYVVDKLSTEYFCGSQWLLGHGPHAHGEVPHRRVRTPAPTSTGC